MARLVSAPLFGDDFAPRRASIPRAISAGLFLHRQFFTLFGTVAAVLAIFNEANGTARRGVGILQASKNNSNDSGRMVSLLFDLLVSDTRDGSG